MAKTNGHRKCRFLVITGRRIKFFGLSGLLMPKYLITNVKLPKMANKKGRISGKISLKMGGVQKSEGILAIPPCLPLIYCLKYHIICEDFY